MKKPPDHFRYTQPQNGFTLIELSIVLMIIGLLVSGILIGKDLILAAQMRSTIKEVGNYNVAVRAFQTKYGGLPGDIDADRAFALGFIDRDGEFARGNNDGLIENGCPDTDADRYTTLANEGLGFWADLAQAEMISFQPVLAQIAYDDSTIQPCGSVTIRPQKDGYFPPAKLNAALYYAAIEDGGNNYLMLSGIDMSNTRIPLTHLISPIMAYGIDSKIDDGLPLSGGVTALTISRVEFDTRTLPTPAASASGVCVTNAANSPYNTANGVYAEANACSLRFRIH